MSNSADRAEDDSTADVTRLLSNAAAGKSAATRELFNAVYDQLRQLARQRMAGERADHTLQPTALVHEVYLRLVGDRQLPWQNRGHFYAAAAEAMRRVLLDHAKARARKKRGGSRPTGGHLVYRQVSVPQAVELPADVDVFLAFADGGFSANLTADVDTLLTPVAWR